MLRITQNSSVDGAKSYFTTADYYTEGQELKGVWRGKGAERLGLSGEVDQRDWDRLCENRDPTTGAKLTVRQKSNRTVGYDFTWGVPKGVSVLYGLTGDERLEEAVRDATAFAMGAMEAEMQTRVRRGGSDENRTTGNMVYGEFLHSTARPVEGVPDPHMHVHCFVLNETFDSVEGRWKAGQFQNLKRDAPYFEALFDSRLASNLETLGLAVERSRKGWDLAGFPKSAAEKFSRRTKEIEAKAAALGITDPGEKGALGAKTREKKRKQLPMSELRALWASWLTKEEGDAVQGLIARMGSEPVQGDRARTAEAVSRAIGHVFQRSSVVPERTLVAEAMKGAIGSGTVQDVEAELGSRELLYADRGGRRFVTTRDVLAEEESIVAFAKEGRGRCQPLAKEPHTFRREWLNKGQRSAVEHVLGSRDRVILVRGAAGTGKTAMLQEAAEAIEASGKRLFAFAQSSSASRGVLRQEAGIQNADTVAMLFASDQMQEELRGQVCWIDEASQLSAPDMGKLFALAERLDARVVLSGDKRQHGSVERGSVLRMLEEEAGLVPAEITEIQRQQHARYKGVVHALSEGRVEEGFRELDRLGWIREVPDDGRYQVLAEDYVATTMSGKTALVVSPTHREADQITTEIRRELKAKGKLKGEDRVFSVLDNRNLTEAERTDAVNYAPSDVLVFHQNAKGFTKGDRVAVGQEAPPVSEAARFQVYRPEKLSLAAGDRVRITRNGATLDGKHKLNTGDLFTIKRFDKGGNLVLSNDWTVAKDYGHMAHGYVVTSYGSQGQTVQRVIIGQSLASMPASSQQQFYVSVSRGKESAVIYTGNKEELLEGVARSEDRMTATELLRERGRQLERQRAVERQQGEKGTRERGRDGRELAYG